MLIRDVTTGATGATAGAPKFSDALTLSQILPTIAEVAANIFPFSNMSRLVITLMIQFDTILRHVDTCLKLLKCDAI